MLISVSHFQRRIAHVVPRIQIGALRDQKLDDGGEAGKGRRVQRRVALSVRLVHVRAKRQQQPGSFNPITLQHKRVGAEGLSRQRRAARRGHQRRRSILRS